jgi:hypothetical protein
MPFVRSVQLLADDVPDAALWPWSMPAVRALRTPLELDERATILVGENGSGKSTIVEALAVALGMNAEGGSNHMRFSTRASHSALHDTLRIARTVDRPRTRYFRASARPGSTSSRTWRWSAAPPPSSSWIVPLAAGRCARRGPRRRVPRAVVAGGAELPSSAAPRKPGRISRARSPRERMDDNGQKGGLMESSSPAYVLVVAHKTAASPALLDAIRERAARGPAFFHLLVPNPAPPHWPAAHPERREKISEGERVLAQAVPLIEAAAHRPTYGSVSTRHDVMDAIEEAVHDGDFDEIILSTLPPGISRWLHVDLPHRVAHLGLPLTTVVAAKREPAELA